MFYYLCKDIIFLNAKTDLGVRIMRVNDKYKFVIYYLPVLLIVIVALGFFPVVKVADKLSPGFSAERVAEDIKYISKQPHSIQHPRERAVVRDYLFHRLENMGAQPQRFAYDSIACKFGGYYDIENLYAVFNPPVVTDSTNYVLLVAHMDSRYFNVVLKDTVYSYGAADDGYGLGIILESVGQALKYRSEWKQGIKVLFTDSEEHELDGMTSAVKQDRYLFDNVNFIVNLEARGVKGDALLFETTAGNSAVMDLYKKASKPRGFSLTTLIYNVMPNDTDFTLLRDSIPGINVAVIENLHYYHTDKDHFSNISKESIQHYGAQLEPIINEYLVSDKYSSATSLVSTTDQVFFSFPILGMFQFTHLQYSILNIVTYLLFVVLLLLYVWIKRVKMERVLKECGYVLLFAVGAFLIGEGIAWLAASAAGLPFDLVAVKYVKYDNLIVLCTCAALVLVLAAFFKRRPVPDSLLGTLLLMCIFSFIMYVTVFENFFILLPLLICTLAMLAGLCRKLRFLYILSAMLITLVSVYFLNLLYIAITIGALGIILMLGTLSALIILLQYYYYKTA